MALWIGALVLCSGAAAMAQPEETIGMQGTHIWPMSVYHRTRADETPPATPVEGIALSARALRNETVAFQLGAWTDAEGAQLRMRFQPLRGDGADLDASAWEALYADYVHTDEEGELADPLTAEPIRTMPTRRVQPIWVRLHVPADCKPGVYTGRIEALAGAHAQSASVRVEVLADALPDARQGRFHLDLWQHPAAIARYHRTPLWSEAHWTLLRAYTRLAADGGQNPITACIIHDPWASQTYDPHASMVAWIRQADGAFRFDFTIFDQYVAMCLEEGLPGPVNCYSLAMGPGDRLDCPIRYWDEATSTYQRLECTVGDATYQAVWAQFFAAFRPHLEERGWFDNVCVAIDEAQEQKMEAMLAAVPSGWRVALAGNYHESLDARLHDYCIIYPGAGPDVSRARRERGQITTFYTCTGPAWPNTFVFSPLVESRLLAWHALQIGADGYLRWAFSSWPEDPMQSAAFKPWQSGDTFVVYPGPRTSLRYEMLRTGIQDFEAFHIARGKAPDDPRLAEALRRANAEHDGRAAQPAEVDAARALVNDVLAEQP